MANVKISAFSTVSGTPPNINNMGGLAGYEGSANVQISGTELIASLETNLNLSNFTSGTLAVNKGGTGENSYIDGQLLIGNTTNNTLTKATLTEGSNITITNGNGSITIASTDQHVGTVTSVTSGDPNTITIVGGTSATPTVAANTAAVATSGAKLATGGQIATYVTGLSVTDLTAPTSSFSMNSQKITGLLNPTANQEAATKNYVDASVSSATVFQGDYDATTDPATGTGVLTGFTYVVTVAGTGVNNFWSSTVDVGEFIIAKQDNPTSESNWTVVPSTVGLATAGNSTTAVAGKASFDNSYFTVASNGFTSLLTVGGLTAAKYNNANVTVDVKGRVTAIEAGTDNDTTYDLVGIGSGNTDSGIRLTDGTNNDDVLIIGSGSVTASQSNNTITLTGTDTQYSDFTNSSAGLVPDPGGSGNSVKFLNEDGSFKEPSYTTYPLFYDTNNNPAAQNGLVPAPNSASGDLLKFLRGDGTWQTVSGGGGDTYTLTAETSSNDALLTLDATSGSDSSVKFIAGTDIGLTVDTSSSPKTITIASTATTYNAMTTSTLGLGKLRYATGSTPAAETQSVTANRTYGITENDSNQLIVNVPWTDTTDNADGTAGQLQYTTGNGVFAATSDMVYTTDQLKVQNTLYLDGNGASAGSGSAGIVKLGCELAGANHYVGLEGPTHEGNNSYIIKFPDPDPSVGKILKVSSFANDKAVMEWADDTSIYAADGVLSGDRTVTMGANNLTFDSSGGLFTIQKNLKVEGQSYGDITSVSNATVNWDNGNIQSITLPSGASTYTPTNPQAGATYILKIIQPSAGDGTITWGSSVKWPGATAPILTASNAAVDVVTLIYDGTNYLATSVLNLS